MGAERESASRAREARRYGLNPPRGAVSHESRYIRGNRSARRAVPDSWTLKAPGGARERLKLLVVVKELLLATARFRGRCGPIAPIAGGITSLAPAYVSFGVAAPLGMVGAACRSRRALSRLRQQKSTPSTPLQRLGVLQVLPTGKEVDTWIIPATQRSAR